MAPSAPRQKGTARLARAGRAALLAAVAVALVLPAVFLADPIAYAPPIAAALLVLVSFLYLQALSRSLSVSVAQMAGNCERGEATPLSVTLSNRSALPFPRVQLDFYVTDLFGDYDDVRPFTCALGGHETLTTNFEVRFAHLGTYHAGVSRVVVWDLLGLFHRSAGHGDSRVVAVRPRRVDMGRADSSRALPDEDRSALRPVAADDVNYTGVREYRFGDPLKTVHWTMSARDPNGRLYTRLFEAYVNPSLTVVVDPYAPELGAEDLMSLFDGMVEVAASLCAQAREAGVESEVRFISRTGEPRSCHLANEADADDLVAEMMPVTAVPEGAAAPRQAEEMLRAAGLRAHGSGNVAYVAARPDAAALSALADAAAARRNAMAFLAVPRALEGRERDRFVSPLRSLADAGASYYVVESTELATEVVGL